MSARLRSHAVRRAPPRPAFDRTTRGDAGHRPGEAPGDHGRAVGAAVVGDRDAPRQREAIGQEPGQPGDARLEHVGFVVGGDDDLHGRQPWRRRGWWSGGFHGDEGHDQDHERHGSAPGETDLGVPWEARTGDPGMSVRPSRWYRVGSTTDRADVAQLVEHHLAKVRVAGSNPVVRSNCLVTGGFSTEARCVGPFIDTHPSLGRLDDGPGGIRRRRLGPPVGPFIVRGQHVH